MRTHRFWLAVLLVVSGFVAQPRIGAVDTADTKLLSEPAISATHIAFIYAGDLYSADLNGGDVRRLTSDDGIETNPVFSPDGSTIAFSTKYGDNLDVFTVPVTGGSRTRLTWHPGLDAAQSFTPDGRAVLFASTRAGFKSYHVQLYTVPVQGGVEEPLPIPTAARATYSPDGARIAYNPLPQQFLEWKQYRGGMVAQIWLYTSKGHGIEKIPQPASRANDTDPMWLGDIVYFRSDRNGEFNVFAFNTRSKRITQLTRHTDFPVLYASAGNGRIIYEQAGSLHILETQTGRSRKLTIGVAADLPETRPRVVKGAKWIRDADLSPTGARAVFEFRGEIVTMSGDKGDVRNLTNSAGAHDRDPSWSPDGRSIAWFSDRTGEYQLYIGSADGTAEPRAIKVAGMGFYFDPVWSPDSQKIAYWDMSQSVYWVDVASGVSRRIASQPRIAPWPLTCSWSPDSKWLAYAMSNKANISTVYAHSVEQNRSFQISDGRRDVGNPAFDKSGKYLLILASTDPGPVIRDFTALSNVDRRVTSTIHLAVLQNDVVSPLPGGSDKEGPRASVPVLKPFSGNDAPFRIDFDGLQSRILALPIPPGDLSNVQTGSAGQIYYLKTIDSVTSLNRNDLTTRQNETLFPADWYVVSADGHKLLYRHGDNRSIVPTTKSVGPTEGRIPVDAIEVRIDPLAEWRQIFDEAWRINRDFFYAPNMHGLDWTKQRQKYAAFLPHLATRADLNRILQWMSSELSVSHHDVDGGDALSEPKSVPVGLLGADYEAANGRYRLRKVYEGLNWDPQVRAPLTEPGVNAKAGEYILAVNGNELRPPTNIYSLFENTSDRVVELTLGPNADGTRSRIVQAIPVNDEASLRRLDWVEGNLKKVEEATGGRVAYVYVPNTDSAGYTSFNRYFYSQVDRDALILDGRFNSGGRFPDYFIDTLDRPSIGNAAMRYGEDLKIPLASIQGPKAMLIDESAGSGGDMLPWMFRMNKIGPLIGKRTWGGMVGGLSTPVLMDGGMIAVPYGAYWSRADGWAVENEGVAPDIEVEQTPAAVIAGRDPQLEKAIEVVMAALRKNPPVSSSRPAYPVKGRTLRGTVP
jgi:tricorn protease